MKLRIEKVGGEYFLDAVENNSIKNIAVFKNYDDALRARDALLAKPPCYNRPPRAWGRVEHPGPDRGYYRELASKVAALVRNAVLEECASEFEGQYTDSCPGTNISAAIRAMKKDVSGPLGMWGVEQWAARGHCPSSAEVDEYITDILTGVRT